LPRRPVPWRGWHARRPSHHQVHGAAVRASFFSRATAPLRHGIWERFPLSPRRNAMRLDTNALPAWAKAAVSVPSGLATLARYLKPRSEGLVRLRFGQGCDVSGVADAAPMLGFLRSSAWPGCATWSPRSAAPDLLRCRSGATRSAALRGRPPCGPCGQSAALSSRSALS
jgi:hypothetical protein